MVTETDLQLGAGGRLHVYDSGPDLTGPDLTSTDLTSTDLTSPDLTSTEQAGARLTILWQHGTPNTGAPPEPLFPAAAERGIRWVSYDRPGYGGSTPLEGRNVASATADIARIADALGIGQFAVLGHSGGGPYALACGALLAERVLGVVCISGLAPFQAEGLDWFAGMTPSGMALLRAASRGRAALEDYLASTEFDPGQFTAADQAALLGEWSWLGRVAGQAIRPARRGCWRTSWPSSRRGGSTRPR